MREAHLQLIFCLLFMTQAKYSAKLLITRDGWKKTLGKNETVWIYLSNSNLEEWVTEESSGCMSESRANKTSVFIISFKRSSDRHPWVDQ